MEWGKELCLCSPAGKVPLLRAWSCRRWRWERPMELGEGRTLKSCSLVLQMDKARAGTPDLPSKPRRFYDSTNTHTATSTCIESLHSSSHSPGSRSGGTSSIYLKSRQYSCWRHSSDNNHPHAILLFRLCHLGSTPSLQACHTTVNLCLLLKLVVLHLQLLVGPT